MDTDKDRTSPDKWHADVLTQDPTGVFWHVYCKGCKHYLTSIKLNHFCVIDMDIECTTCRAKLESRNLRADPPVRVNIEKK